jgi:hypothetical protein
MYQVEAGMLIIAICESPNLEVTVTFLTKEPLVGIPCLMNLDI